MISYQNRSLQFGANAGGGMFALSDFKTGVEKVHEASRTAEALDNCMYQICKLYEHVDKKSKRYEEYVEDQKKLIYALTIFNTALEGFKINPDSNEDSLKKVIKEMRQSLRKLENPDANDAGFWYDRSYFHIKLGNVDQGLEDFKKTINCGREQFKRSTKMDDYYFEKIKNNPKFQKIVE